MDADLVTRAQQGDERAFASIVEAIGARHLGVARRILHDAQLAEDATQQALVKLWRHLPSLRDPARFDAWSYRLLVKACYSESRRRRRWRSDVGLRQADRSTVSDDVATIIDRDQLERGLRRISIDHRTVLVLRYYVDLPLLAGSALAVVAQDEAAAPVEFTAKWGFGPDLRSATSEVVDGVRQGRGGAWRPDVLVAASDPRLQGELSIAANFNDYTATGGPEVGSAAFRIENDEGTWQMMPVISLDHGDGEPHATTGVMVGEDGYAGLIAVFDTFSDGQAGTWDLHGYIIGGELPPPPEPVVSE
jgi:RNA polymerase sigma-70 factor (ECF subfamily)